MSLALSENFPSFVRLLSLGGFFFEALENFFARFKILFLTLF
jgi:hypothetical protein